MWNQFSEIVEAQFRAAVLTSESCFFCWFLRLPGSVLLLHFSLSLSLFFFFSLYGAHSVQFWFTSQQFLLSALSFLDREPCPGRKLVSATFHHTELSLCPRPLLGQWPVSRRFMVLCVCFSLLSFAQMLTPCCPRGDGGLSSHACILRFVSKKSNHRALL